ncbi:MAG TPA: outer membrane beta-barrel protein [Povalibacter sp.]|nr:outer membrane beta-barrel protein [Povalibacter sp.]
MNRRFDNAATDQRGDRAARCVALLTGLLAIPLAWAAEPPAKEKPTIFEVTPFIGAMGGGKFEDPTDGSDRDAQSGTNFGFFLNLNADSPERQYEMFYTQQGTEVEGVEPFDMDVQYLHVGGIVNFTDVQPVVPYFGITVGATRFAPSGPDLDDETKLSFSVGSGAKYQFNRHFGVRLDLRVYATLVDTNGDFFCVSTPTTGGTCRIRAASDTFLQYSGSLGFIAAF